MTPTRSIWPLFIAPAVLVAVCACGPAAPAPATPPPAPAAAAGGDQVAQGQALYEEHCASCHGAHGEGAGKSPPVVGANALPLNPPPGAKMRKTQFHTAADVYAFVKANMPLGESSLTDAQYAAILAFDLKANGVDVTGKTIDAASAAAIVLHP